MAQVEEQKQARFEAGDEKDTASCRTEEGRFVVDQFYRNLPEMENVKEWYAGFTPEGYNEWARVVNFTEPYHIIDQACKSAEEGGMGIERSALVLDVGSGTGVIGQAMQNEGFTTLHALDVSTNFLDACRERGFYVDHHNFFLGKGVDQFPDHLKGKYDVITASGVWMPGHMPKEGMDDIHAALKVGGLWITAMRMTMWADGNVEAYKEKVESLIAAGKIEMVKQTQFFRGSEGGTGLFGKQESTCLVLRKIAE
jgi:SAM-dependent methyltransferase